jgi:4-hydroxy-3-polyprenylbenzoate decarboxylase
VSTKKRIIVAITGASGVNYGIRFLEILKTLGFETHLILSNAGKKLISIEGRLSVSEVEKLASYTYHEDDIGAALASGSFIVDSMVVVPCSMGTLSAVAHGFENNLITRAAGCILKQRKKLVLVPRETPLSIIQIENMSKVAKSGAIVLPAMPAFYPQPKTIIDLEDFICGKILDVLGIDHQLYKRWKGEN